LRLLASVLIHDYIHIDIPEEGKLRRHDLVFMWLRRLNPVLNISLCAGSSELLEKHLLTLLLGHQFEWVDDSLSMVVEGRSDLLSCDSVLGHEMVFFLACQP
jgi:hypothetical protein